MGQWKRIIESIRVDTMPEGIDKIRASIANLTASIEYGEQKLASFNKTEMRTLGETISAGVESKKKQLAEYQIQLEEVLRKQREVDAGSPKTGGGAVPSGPSDEEIRRREELTNKIKELNSQVNASDLQLAQNNFQRMQTTSSLEALNFQQKKQANEQYLLQKSQLEKFYSDNGVNDEILRNQGRESLEQTHTNKLIEIQQNYLTQRRQISADVGNEDISLSNAWDQVADGFKAKNEELKKNFKATFQEIGRNAREGLAAGVAQGFAAVGAALVEGKNALEEFAKAFIGTVGQMAIASGTRFILEGYAWSTIPGFQVEGAAMISTGIALATFGGALTALSGAMGANSKSSGGGAGGYDSGGGMAGGFDSGQNGAGPIAPEEIAAQIPKTEVNLTINGNILDRRQTGLEIAQILEEQFADQGLVLKGA
jgi:hypothetical protein